MQGRVNRGVSETVLISSTKNMTKNVRQRPFFRD